MAAFLTACTNGGGSEGTPPTRLPETITLTKATDGTTVEAVIGDRIELRLRSDHNCPGYAWVAKEQSDDTVLRFETTLVDEPPPSKPNADGRDVLIYRAVGDGSVVLRLKFVDPDRPGYVGETVSMTVNVRKPE